jgi:hypothetical protein
MPYQMRVLPPSSPPTREATTPKSIKVIAKPMAKTSAIENERWREVSRDPAMKPMINGIMVMLQGPMEVTMPPANTRK